MNKNIFITLCLAALLSACQSMEEVQNESVISDTFTAIMEPFETETKTYFEDKYAVWSENDEIAVFQGRSKVDKYVLKSSKDTIVFGLPESGHAESYDGSYDSLSTNIAVYPYDESMSCEEDDTAYFVRNVTFPAVQQFMRGSFAEESFIMVAKTSGLDDRTLRFKNVCGGLRLQIKPLPGDTMIVKSIILEGHNNENISGKADVIYSKTGEISHKWTSDAKKYITVEVPSVLLDTSATSFQCVISLPPVQFAQGFDVTINAEVNGVDSSYTRTTIKPQNLRRSRFLTMPDIHFGEYIKTPSLKLSHRELEFSFEKGTKTLKLESNTEWAGTSDSEWLTLSPASGKNNASVTVTASANELPQPRTAVLKFNVQDIERTVTVTQAGKPLFDISRTSASVKAEGEEISVNVTSNVDWHADTDDNWITLAPSGGEGSDEPVVMKISVLANDSEEERQGTVLFDAGGLKTRLTITQRGKMVEIPKKYYIDEYGINHGYGIQVDDVVWAPVNCGYHKDDNKYGKLYQWGRKHGQQYSTTYDESEIIEGPKSKDDGQKDKYSKIFFTSTSENNNDWCSTQEDKLWNSGTENEPVKTACDPCPDGWRVPTYSELNSLQEHFSDWTSDGNSCPGCYFSGKLDYDSSVPQVFFSAAGYRNNQDGSASLQGLNGYYWSSTPRGTSIRILYFTTNYANIDSGNRACGYAVRCVQE